MTTATMTNNEALALYNASLLIIEGTDIVTTRHAAYQWNPQHGHYECIDDSLEVAHRAGVRWHKGQQCFIECTCRWCVTHPHEVVNNRIRTTGLITSNA
jgi:hypothetical protein